MAVPDSRLIVRRIHAVSDRALAFETCRVHGSGTALTVDEFADSLPGARSAVRQIHACSTDARLATWVHSGRSEDGGAVELVFHVVYHRAGQVADYGDFRP
jgi:hypothetical protein